MPLLSSWNWGGSNVMDPLLCLHGCVWLLEPLWLMKANPHRSGSITLEPQDDHIYTKL